MKCDVQRNSIHIPFETVALKNTAASYSIRYLSISLSKIDNAPIAQPYCIMMIQQFARCDVKYCKKYMRLCVKSCKLILKQTLYKNTAISLFLTENFFDSVHIISTKCPLPTPTRYAINKTKFKQFSQKKLFN